MNAPDRVPAYVPVVVVGAGPTGIAAATLLGKFGIQTLVLDRWKDVYPQPRAVHTDDEVFRILAALGVRDQLAAISHPALGPRLFDPNMRVQGEIAATPLRASTAFPRQTSSTNPSSKPYPRQLQDAPCRDIKRNAEVTELTQTGRDRVRVRFTDRVSGSTHVVDSRYVLGCDGANSRACANRFQRRHLSKSSSCVARTSSDGGAEPGLLGFSASLTLVETLRWNSNCVMPSLSANSRAESTILLRIDGSTVLGIASSTSSTNLRTASIAFRRSASSDFNLSSDMVAASSAKGFLVLSAMVALRFQWRGGLGAPRHLRTHAAGE